MLVEVFAAYRDGIWIVEPPRGAKRTAQHRDFVTTDDPEIVSSGLCDATPLAEGDDQDFASRLGRTLVIGKRLGHG